MTLNDAVSETLVEDRILAWCVDDRQGYDVCIGLVCDAEHELRSLRSVLARVQALPRYNVDSFVPAGESHREGRWVKAAELDAGLTTTEGVDTMIKFTAGCLDCAPLSAPLEGNAAYWD